MELTNQNSHALQIQTRCPLVLGKRDSQKRFTELYGLLAEEDERLHFITPNPERELDEVVAIWLRVPFGYPLCIASKSLFVHKGEREVRAEYSVVYDPQEKREGVEN